MATLPATPDLFDLPPDCLRLVLSSLDAPSLAAVGSTCTAGRAAALDDELWAGLAARLAGRVAVERGSGGAATTAAASSTPASAAATTAAASSTPASAAAARAARIVGPLTAWDGIDSYRALVLGLLHPFSWALAGPLAIPGTCHALGGLVSARVLLPRRPCEYPACVVLELCTPSSFSRGLDRCPLFRVEAGTPPSAARPSGVKPEVLCLRIGRAEPGVVPLPGAHPVTLVVKKQDGGGSAVTSVSITCGGGCVTALTLSRARVEAAMKTCGAPQGDVAPGGIRSPPLRPGLPDYGDRTVDMGILLHTIRAVRLDNSNAPERASRLEMVPLACEGWWGGGGGGGGDSHSPPSPGPHGLSLAARYTGLWKGAYGAHGPELVAIAARPPPEATRPGENSAIDARFPLRYLAAIKVTGDANVPAGKLSFDAGSAVEAAGAGEAWTSAVAEPSSPFGFYRFITPFTAATAQATPPPLLPVTLGNFLSDIPGLKMEDPSVDDGDGEASPFDALRVSAAHPACGTVAEFGFTDPTTQACLFLELDGWEGEAFVLLWQSRPDPDPDGLAAQVGRFVQCCLFVRVHENEVMG